MAEVSVPEIGELGVWRRGSEVDPALAQHVETLGYGAVWVGGSPPADLAHVEELVAATRQIVVATGIVNIWVASAREVAESFHRIEERHPGRLLLGIGAGHPEAQGEQARRPYAAMVRYLDELESAGVPSTRIVLAALGPRMLRLARDRSAGAHPYLVTPAHTGQARALLGPDRLLAPEQRLVLRADPSEAMRIGKPSLTSYLAMSNYHRNLRRLGFDDAELEGSGSDALADALIAHGTDEKVAARLREHLDAGADHVAAQVLTGGGDDVGEAYTRLARAFGLSPRPV